MRGIAARTIAGIFALAAFAVAVLAGLSAGNAAVLVLSRAIIAMLICYPVGLAVGLVAQRLVQDHIDSHRAANPAADSTGDDDEPGADNEDGEEILVA